MKPYIVVIHNGTVTTHTVRVRGRYHEESEREALLATGISFESVVTIATREA